MTTNYPGDLTDNEWEMIKTLLSHRQSSPKWHKRSLVNTVLYIKDNGCKWRDYPPAVWTFSRRARKSGLWARIMDALVKKHAKRQGANLRQPME